MMINKKRGRKRMPIENMAETATMSSLLQRMSRTLRLWISLLWLTTLFLKFMLTHDLPFLPGLGKSCLNVFQFTRNLLMSSAVPGMPTQPRLASSIMAREKSLSAISVCPMACTMPTLIGPGK